jgi:hypothetical protein
MKWVNLKIEKLIKADWNYKEDDEELLSKLIANIKKNGQIENLIVRELGNDKYEIVNGNHRYDALIRLKIKEVMCCNLGVISLDEAKRIAIETNETRFNSNNIKLYSIIDELIEIGMNKEDLISTMPYDLDEINNFQELNNINYESFLNEEQEKNVVEEQNDNIDLRKEEYYLVLEFDTEQEYSDFIKNKNIKKNRINFKELGINND